MVTIIFCNGFLGWGTSLLINSLRNELIINLRFWLDLFAASFVKKPRDSAAMAARPFRFLHFVQSCFLPY